MRATVIGAGGTIGKALCKALAAAGHEVIAVTRNELDLLNLPEWCPPPLQGEVAYLCAAKTRFIDCEADSDAYRVNVDAPAHIGKWFPKTIYLSSEAVERALHTNYGMHKALAEISLRAVCDPVIVRLAKVDAWSMHDACAFLIGLAKSRPGVYRWRAPAERLQAVA